MALIKTTLKNLNYATWKAFCLIFIGTLTFSLAEAKISEDFKVSAPKAFKKIRGDNSSNFAIFQNASENSTVVLSTFSSLGPNYLRQLQKNPKAVQREQEKVLKLLGIENYRFHSVEVKSSKVPVFKKFAKVVISYSDAKGEPNQVIQRIFVNHNRVYVISYVEPGATLTNPAKVDSILQRFQPKAKILRGVAAAGRSSELVSSSRDSSCQGCESSPTMNSKELTMQWEPWKQCEWEGDDEEFCKAQTIEDQFRRTYARPETSDVVVFDKTIWGSCVQGFSYDLVKTVLELGFSGLEALWAYHYGTILYLEGAATKGLGINGKPQAIYSDTNATLAAAGIAAAEAVLHPIETTKSLAVSGTNFSRCGTKGKFRKITKCLNAKGLVNSICAAAPGAALGGGVTTKVIKKILKPKMVQQRSQLQQARARGLGPLPPVMTSTGGSGALQTVESRAGLTRQKGGGAHHAVIAERPNPDMAYDINSYKNPFELDRLEPSGDKNFDLTTKQIDEATRSHQAFLLKALRIDRKAKYKDKPGLVDKMFEDEGQVISNIQLNLRSGKKLEDMKPTVSDTDVPGWAKSYEKLKRRALLRMFHTPEGYRSIFMWRQKGLIPDDMLPILDEVEKSWPKQIGN